MTEDNRDSLWSSRRNILKYIGLAGTVGFLGAAGIRAGQRPGVALPNGTPNISSDAVPGLQQLSKFKVTYEDLNTDSPLVVKYILTVDGTDQAPVEQTFEIEDSSGTVTAGNTDIVIPSGGVSLSIAVVHPSLASPLTTSAGTVESLFPPFDLRGYTLDASIDSQGSTPTDFAFNNNGTKLFVVDDGTIYTSTLSTGFDLSTATFQISLRAPDRSTDSITFNDDGSKLFGTGDGSDLITESSLSTNFDPSTVTSQRSIDAQGIFPNAIRFNDDGTTLHEFGRAQNTIAEFTLSTGFDLSTAEPTRGTTPPVVGEGRSLSFNNDGSKAFVLDFNSSKIFAHALSTKFDLHTARFIRSIDAQDSDPTGIAFNDTGRKMFELGSGDGKIHEYTY
jgi:DNA-binding beta-propeller fold protein YncE